MAWYNFPFVIVLIATILPWVAAFFDQKWITYVPLLLSLFFYYIYEGKKKSSEIRISYGFVFTIFIISISVFWQLRNGIGIGSGGTIIILVLSYIYYRLFLFSKNCISSTRLMKQLHIIYAVQIIFILCELIFRLFGGTDIIVSLVGTAKEVAIYKMYNKAVFLKFIGFENMTGLGGLLLGSQSASQVALFAVFLFAPFYNHNIFYRYNRIPFLWFYLSIISFLLCITMTASILSLIMFFLLFFYLPNSKYKKLKYKLSIIIISIIFFIPISRLIFFNINNQNDYLTYFNSFYASIVYYQDLSVLEKIFGGGRYISQSMGEANITNGSIADFGIGMLLNQAGIFLIGFAFIILFKIFFQVQNIIYFLVRYIRYLNPWIWLGTVNSLIALGWGLSLIHYTPAVELGGRELFAFHLSISLLSLKNMKQIKKEVIINNAN